MPSLERFFNPQMRVFSANITSLPGARLYFFRAGSTTPKVTYANKEGTIVNAHPVVADANGSFPPIFLDGLYRAELRSSGNIVQPGWPIDNVGQDTPIVPYAPWSELVTYAEFERVTDSLTGIVYRSAADNNLGNVPADSPTEWEVVIDPVPSSFTSDASYFSWSDDAGQISLDVDQPALNSLIGAAIGASTAVAAGGDFTGSIYYGKIGKIVILTCGVLTHSSLGSPQSGFVIPVGFRPTLSSIRNVYYFNGSSNITAQITIQTDGKFIIDYNNSAGSPVSRTNSISGFAISYILP